VGVHRAPPEPGHGLDITLVLDASGSMRALDAVIDGEWGPRLDLAREVVARFAEHRAMEGDRIALVVFGESAFTLCPLTGDGVLLASALARVEAGMVGEATALGEDGPLAGRVIVLLTDGRHNAGAFSLETATALAAAVGVRVHTVAIGSSGDDVAMERSAGAPHFERHDVDPEGLRAIASATGGRFFAARRAADLADVYAEIDRIERVPRRLPPRLRRSERPEPLLALAGGLLLSEIALARVAGRRLP
jgi:Ca-activated chloride channel family protein